MGNESTFDIEEDSEVFISFFNCNYIHLTKWESWISSDLAVNLDETLLVLDDLSAFVSAESVLEFLLEKNVKWNAFSKLVWTWRWSGSIHTLELSEVPLLWTSNPLHNLSLAFVSLNKTCEMSSFQTLECTKKHSVKQEIYLPFL